jgi:hypothetical protein
MHREHYRLALCSDSDIDRKKYPRSENGSKEEFLLRFLAHNLAHQTFTVRGMKHNLLP